MSTFMHRPLGPGAHARALVCSPGESLLWAVFARSHHYDIDGLDQLGAPVDGGRARGLGRMRGSATDDLIGDDNDDSDDAVGSDPLPPPDVIVCGPEAGCLAHEHLAKVRPVSRTRLRLWVLTSRRLAILEQRVRAEVPADAAPVRSSPLARMSRLGRGLTRLGRTVTDTSPGTRATFGDNVEGEPVAPKEFRPAVEIPHDAIAGGRVATRRTTPCVRLSLVDGSGFDFLVLGDDGAACARMAAMTNGAP
ncbi:hypothetical protein [Prauserella cavernicola]|uniref:Uncharacterized protein n=1 Tax=Prauserella cavernicola TaxID=2800127 RepID=A0A934V1L1_9PSEU|nr:hypothetical protein [Prauserella cavernicola]MBK1783416.1 hypothetical protein [Prauserella cavernicola]